MTFGLGYWEIALILVFALVIIGPKKLPKLMRDLGRIMGQLRRTSDDLRRELLFTDEINQVKNTVRDVIDPTRPPPVPPKIKVKPEPEVKQAVEDADWRQDPAYQESPPSTDESTPSPGDAPDDG